MKKAIIYALFLSLIVAGVIYIGFHLIANILQNYVVYIAFVPTYPFAWLAPIVRMTGQILAILAFTFIFVIKIIKRG